jgi:hypothetical protein
MFAASPLRKPSSDKAAALIIVLAFVVLLTGLGLAYFSGTTTDRQLAHSSYNDTSADLLARSALDIVVGDFKQEIVNGSMVTTVDDATVYIPVNAAKMVPQQSGNIAGVPNLIRRSVRSDPLSGNPGMPSRASAVNSQNNPSANGRKVTSTRWNAHYLVPKGNIATADSSPIPAFTGATPDWVIVTRAGPVRFDGWDPTLVDSTNTNYAVGRYAYAVYDEGGLLEINVTGYPAPPTPLPAYLADIGRKGVPTWADLKALVPTPTPIGSPIANRVVGFRNYATTGQNNVSNLNFSYTDNSQIQSFVDYFLGNQIVNGAPVSGSARVGVNSDFASVRTDLIAGDSRTDQGFTTRAELIKFLTSAFPTNSAVVNVLQYLGTFSREKNQPTLPLTTDWPFARRLLPQRFYLGNLNEVVNPGNAANIRQYFGLQFANAVVSGSGPCDSQVRWQYVGSGEIPCPLITPTPTPTGTPTATPTPTGTATPAVTPLSYIPGFPCDLTKLEFFQYLNYALFGVTGDDFAHITSTLGIGAALIDMYDVETSLITGLNYSPPIPTPTPTPTAVVTPTPTPTPTACDNPTINTYLVYGAEQPAGSPASIRTGIPTGISPPPTPEPVAGVNGPPSINQGFRNVGEFGWAYSILDAAYGRNNVTGTPRYLIDFQHAYKPNSDPNPMPPDSAHNPDPALLDFFTYNRAPVRSGIVSLNTRQAPVLAALLSQAIYGGTSLVLSPTQATNAATSIITATTAQPAMSRADIARFASVVTSPPFGSGIVVTQDTKDTFARVFSETTQTRTWGLLIDLVAQTGHYKPNVDCQDPLHNCLADFVVEGEKRYWLHIAIDRFDGTIVGQQLEEVTE